MARTAHSEFKFRRSDTIGAASAEEDTEFLRNCFVETDEYEILRAVNDVRQIVLGRTGTGKSALFERLRQEDHGRVITIEPHELALTYVSASTTIRYFSDLGVNLDPFYKLLWRHVLTIEVLQKHFEPRKTAAENGIWTTLVDMFPGRSRRDKDAKQAVQYLRTWTGRFWTDIEYRVKEITNKMENDLSAQLSATGTATVLGATASTSMGSSLSVEERGEVIHRGQEVVSRAQVQDLRKMQALLEAVLTDRQKCYYVLIDRLDEDWVEEKLRYRLIMALLEAVREISRVPHVKVLVAVRRDLIDRVFRQVRETGAGFQEEKYQSLYLPLRWRREDLIAVLDKRVDALVARRYEKNKSVSHRDLLPAKVYKVPISEFIGDRATRPRDVISFFNKCIEMADGRPRVSVEALRQAEGEYSRQRLRALGDEWHADYPGLLDFVNVLKKRPASFRLGLVQYESLAELCLESAITYPSGAGVLRELARNVVEGLVDESDFKRTLFMVFYRVGLVGLKLESFEAPSWMDATGQVVSVSEIGEGTGVVVHKTFWRALGIETGRRSTGR